MRSRVGRLSLGRAGCFLGEESILALEGEAEHLLDQAVFWCGGSYRWRWWVMGEVDGFEGREKNFTISLHGESHNQGSVKNQLRRINKDTGTIEHRMPYSMYLQPGKVC